MGIGEEVGLSPEERELLQEQALNGQPMQFLVHVNTKSVLGFQKDDSAARHLLIFQFPKGFVPTV